MVGLRRLDNLQDSIVAALRDGVPGDLVETGYGEADVAS